VIRQPRERLQQRFVRLLIDGSEHLQPPLGCWP
jgi:hypothetical protein